MTLRGDHRGNVVAGLAGILWPILAFARIPLTRVLDQPSWTDTRSSIVEFYSAAEFDAGFVLGIAFAAVAYVLFLVFVVRVADLVRRDDRTPRWMDRLIVGGAAMDTALVYAYLAPFIAAVFWADHGGLSGDTYLGLHGLSFGFLWLELITITLWMTPLGIAIVRTGLFPKWLGWALLANAAASLVAFFLPYSVWAVTGGLPYIWVLVAAVILLTRTGRYTEAGARVG